ncbi:MAG: uslA [Dehalococcoidia bacterium]|nr:uslA [Dehalococcoidia bacterium]
MEINRVLVAVSGSKSDGEALTLACNTAKKSKAKVYVIYVIEVKRALPLDAELSMENRRGEDVLGQAESVAEDLDYNVETELLQAREAGSVIVDEAQERKVDLIVMGVDYKRRFGEFTLGDTANYVLKNARCRVWVCREPIL